MPQCGNYGNLLSHFFDKNFVKVILLLQKILKSWFDTVYEYPFVEALKVFHLMNENVKPELSKVQFENYFVKSTDI